jgi:hypothetical protein
MLNALRQPTLPTAYEPPNFTGVTAGIADLLTLAVLISDPVSVAATSTDVLHIPAVEPSGWDDSLETPDLPVPVEAIGEVIAVSDDEEEDSVLCLPVSSAAAGCPRWPHTCGDHWHFSANSQPFEDFRVPLPHNYSPLQEDSIRHLTGLEYEAIAVLASNDLSLLDDRTLWAYMARVAHGSSARCAVYNPMYTWEQRWVLAMSQGMGLDFNAYVYGDLSRPEVIAIPIYHPGMTYWAIGIYETLSNTVHYFDPMLGPLEEQTRVDLLAAVSNFYPHGSWSDSSAPSFAVVPHVSYNTQIGDADGGFHICLLWEKWLSAPHHPTLILPLCMGHERQRISNNLVNIFIGDDEPFLPLPLRSHRVEPLTMYRDSLPHTALLDRIRLAMENPFPPQVVLISLIYMRFIYMLASDRLLRDASADYGHREPCTCPISGTPFYLLSMRRAYPDTSDSAVDARHRDWPIRSLPHRRRACNG